MKPTKLNALLEDSKTVKGKWELTPNHDLQYKSKDLDEEVKLSGTLIAAEASALVFAVTERQKDQKIVTSIHRLTGTWRANPQNQLVFEVERESGKRDALTFKGTWKVGKAHEIIYTYEETILKTKKKESRELVFNGYWDISQKNRLTYFLSKDSQSAFRFRGAFQTQSILAKEGEIRYQVGVEAAGKSRLQTIRLFGKWKISRTLELSFEIEYKDGKKKAITFGGEYALDKAHRIQIELKNEEGQPIGLALVLTKDFLGSDGQAFIRAQKSFDESRLEAGVKLKW